jgi:MFS family permease
MDLDQFKQQLNEKLATDHKGRSGEDIAQMLSKKTFSVIEKLKKSILYEIIFGLIGMILFAVFAFSTKYHSVRTYFGVAAIFIFAFLFLLIYLFKKTNDLNKVQQPVISNLTNYVTLIEEYMKRYFQFTMAMVPICLFFAGWLGYHEKTPVPELDNLLGKSHLGIKLVLTISIVYLISFSVGMYYFTKWYLHKIYGRYVLELKNCIKDLQES